MSFQSGLWTAEDCTRLNQACRVQQIFVKGRHVFLQQQAFIHRQTWLRNRRNKQGRKSCKHKSQHWWRSSQLLYLSGTTAQTYLQETPVCTVFPYMPIHACQYRSLPATSSCDMDADTQEKPCIGVAQTSPGHQWTLPVNKTGRRLQCDMGRMWEGQGGVAAHHILTPPQTTHGSLDTKRKKSTRLRG